MPRAARKSAAPARRRRRSPALVARAAEINARLTERYPHVTTALHYSSAWELLVATILSAQSTDEVVNQVTAELFQRYPTVQDIASAPREELERAIYRTGFFRNKAKSLQEAARYLLEHHNGEVPDRMEDLVKLPGVGRKTANVVLGSFFSRHPRGAAVAPSGPDQADRPGEDRAGPHGAAASGGVDQLLAPPDLVRAAGVPRQGPAL